MIIDASGRDLAFVATVICPAAAFFLTMAAALAVSKLYARLRARRGRPVEDQ